MILLHQTAHLIDLMALHRLSFETYPFSSFSTSTATLSSSANSLALKVWSERSGLVQALCGGHSSRTLIFNEFGQSNDYVFQFGQSNDLKVNFIYIKVE